MEGITSGFPSSLSYRIRSLAGNMSRIGVQITPDRTTGISPNDIITFKLANNSLIDLKTFNFFYQFSTSGTTGTFQHPRLSSSLIERISVIINGNTIDLLPSYGFLYNTLFDLECGSEQLTKRTASTEFYDPTLRFTSADPSSSADVALVGANAFATGTSAPSKIEGAICNFLGFIGSCSTIIDTSDLGDVFFQFQMATPYVLPATINATAQTLAGASFTLDNVYATVDVISFADDSYYNLKASKLASGGLNIGFYSYLNARFASFTKSSGINVSWNVSANSLDQIICTLQKTDASSTSQIIANPLGLVNNTGSVRTEALGDGFAQSYHYVRPGQAIRESRLSINNRPINYGFLSPKEIFLETMKALGYNQQDMTTGINPTIFSLVHFCKYYFAHITDLTIQDNKDFFISGLNSLGSTLTITWEANFSGSSNSQTAIPIMYARCTKLLQVREGRQISVI